tara:strand:- start:4729 stop:4944 length:216 start_codon:yes stop_codon:yes gene_type:complete
MVYFIKRERVKMTNLGIAHKIDSIIAEQGRNDGNYYLIANKLSEAHLLTILALEQQELQYYYENNQEGVYA